MTADEGEAKRAGPPEGGGRRRFEDLPPAAQRALREAEARRAAYLREEARMPKEHGGRRGPDPVRYGDWERKGIAVDF